MRVYSETYKTFFELSNHAVCRAAQRALDELALDAVLRYGRVYYEDGSRKIFFGDKEAEKLARKRGYRDMAVHLRGITIVAVPSKPGVWLIVTVYRNNHPKFRSSPGRPLDWRRRTRRRPKRS